MNKFNSYFKNVVNEAYVNKHTLTNESHGADSSIIVKLQLNLDAIRRIEQLAEADIKTLLEREINQNTDSFIEMMGLDNY